MTIENQRKAHWAKGLAKYMPPLEEFIKYMEENKGKDFEDEASRYFIEKYPMIQNDPHVKSTMFLIGAKMLVVEGWQEINDSKLFYEELGKRFERLFNAKKPSQ